jgi:hypothetical protein
MRQRGQSTLEWVIGAAVILGTLQHNGTIPQTREAELRSAMGPAGGRAHNRLIGDRLVSPWSSSPSGSSSRTSP